LLIGHGEKAGWLAPIALEPPRKKVREKSMTRRAGNKGCLSMTLYEYLKLLDWTGRQIRNDKAGVIPEDCAPILERLECNAETWLDFVKNFRKCFRSAPPRYCPVYVGGNTKAPRISKTSYYGYFSKF